LLPLQISLQLRNGAPLPVRGYIDVRMVYGSCELNGPLFVCDGAGPAILGRSWYLSLGFKLIHESDVSRQAMLSFVCQVGSESGSPGKVTAESLGKRAHYLNFACFQSISDEPVLAVFGENSPVPLMAKEVASLTPTDPEIGQVYTWALSGWPTSDPGGVLSHYYRRREAISTSGLSAVG